MNPLNPPLPLHFDRSALFLDVDGTLLDFEDHPDDVTADVELIDKLLGLNKRLEGALALVTGRALASLDQVFAPHRFAAAGAHGTELRFSDGRLSRPAVTCLSSAARREVSDFCDAAPGVFVEDKPFGVALHYRSVPKLAATCRRFLENLAIESGSGHQVIKGKMVYELVPPGSDKGTAVSCFLAQKNFDGRQPVFVGDDAADESAFHVVNELGGISIRVGRSTATAARYGLRGVGSVRAWLRASLCQVSRVTE